MSRHFAELRERLLRAGVAPRHVRRYLAELNDHLADLTAEEQRKGLAPADAQSAALARLGDTDQLVEAMTSQPQLRAWSVRAPWAAFGLAPVAVLAAAYAAALLILWTGWQWFLPHAITPFGNHTTGVANDYFQLGRAIYYIAPLFVGWGISLLAARQRISPWWPAAGLALIAWLGSAARVIVHRPDGAPGHVGMTLVPHNLPSSLLAAVTVFAVTALPYLAWRIKSQIAR